MAEMTHEAYLQLLEEIKEVIDKLVGVEQNKLDAVHQGELPQVDECIRQEQAISLTLRSLEQRRSKLLQELGLAGVSLSALAEHFPPDLQSRAVKTAAALRSSYGNYNSISSAARMALEKGLREIEQIMNPPAPAPVASQSSGLRAAPPALGQNQPGEPNKPNKPAAGSDEEPPHKKLDFGA